MATTGKAQEIWECTTDGTTWVHVKDPRNAEGWVQKKVGGKGTKRITLSVEEREFNQELVAYEKEEHDPFTNGLLVRISPKTVERGENELSDTELIEKLGIVDDAAFEADLAKIESEVVVRRLLDLSKRHASMLRHEVIQNLVDDRYKIGKTQKVVKEMVEDDAKYADADL
jgi:hypothetical protein